MNDKIFLYEYNTHDEIIDFYKNVAERMEGQLNRIGDNWTIRDKVSLTIELLTFWLGIDDCDEIVRLFHRAVMDKYQEKNE